MDATEKRQKLASRVGGAIGFVFFLVVGIIPSLLLGGRGGLALSDAVLGIDAHEMLIAKMLVGGGMVLGFVVVLFFFVLIGAVIACGVSYLPQCITRINAERAKNGGKLYDLPPSASSADKSALSSPQDPPKS